jgi:amino acid adenylation domain-containing protein
LDVTTPVARVADTLAEARPVALITTRALERKVPACSASLVFLDEPLPPEQALPTTPGPDHLAYLIATSGTTGTPKLVAVEHRSLLNHFLWVHEQVLPDGDVRLPAVSSPAFDASLKQLVGPLLRGGTVWIPSAAERLDPASLVRALAERPRVALNCAPVLWETMLELVELGEAPLPVSLERLLLGGEDLPDALAAQTFAVLPDVVLWNLYGPTEATVNALAARVAPGEAVTIGRPVRNVSAHVLDEDGADQLPDVPGELYLGGVGLARGYFGDPAATAAAFGPHAHTPERRLYRTGDRVVRLGDGRLRFLGRLDSQAKVRGIRIELDELVGHLRAHPGIRDAVVVLHDGSPAAYVVPVDGVQAPFHELRAHLAARLPQAVVPATFTALTALPRTPFGKLDRAALPAPAFRSPPPVTGPRTATEETVAALWRTLLGRDAVGCDESFFDLGGHSLLLVRAHAHLHALAPRLMILDLFRHPTVRTLAAHIDELAATHSKPGLAQA